MSKEAFQSHQEPTTSSSMVASEAVSIQGEQYASGLEKNDATTIPADVERLSRPPHPRDHLSPWLWNVMQVGNAILSLINGYDVSNVANVQIPIYEAFGHIELLPWLSLTFSLCNVAMIPLIRKVIAFCDFKQLALSAVLIIIAGSALIGAAPNIQSVIVGRALIGMASAVLYQIALSYNVIFAYPHELPLVQALMGAFFAIGLITGPIIGGAFAENEHATWKWAFYIVIPITALATLCLIFFPSFRMPTKKGTLVHLQEIDWVGCVLWVGAWILLGLATIFSGPTWTWNSGSAISVWVLFGVVLIALVVQQSFSLFTPPERRIFPVPLLGKRAVVLPSICSLCTAIGYGITLYYTPIYLAFTREQQPLAAAVRLLPFICVFIVMLFISGGLLPTVRYYMPMFLMGAVFMLISSGLQQTITPHTSESAVMGFEAILGAGLGLIWQLAIPISSVVLQPHERLDAAAMFSIAQLGGVAISLSIAGVVYQNVGFDLVRAAVADMGYVESDIRQLLAGTDSPILARSDPVVVAIVVQAVTTALLRCFAITIAAGGICFIAACFMKFEALDIKKPGKLSDTETEKKTALPRSV